MRRVLFLALVLLAAVAALVWAGSLGIGPVLYTREGEQKIVLFFGNPVRVQASPGLWWRLPLLTEVKVFDARFLYLNTASSKIQTRDQERLQVDNYVIWRIADPLRFYASFPGGMPQAESRIDEVVRADVRDVIGQRTIPEVLTEARLEIMQLITEQASEELRDNGIVVTDVRINRTELPLATVQNVYARMRTERERLARKHRAEGEEQGRRIRAEADRDARVTVAEAWRDSEILRGEGDARSAAIYAEAYNADPEFYGFLRSLEAYRKTIGAGTTMVLPPSSEFFRALQNPGGTAGGE
jgi:membrane protease subunit HflC